MNTHVLNTTSTGLENEDSPSSSDQGDLYIPGSILSETKNRIIEYYGEDITKITLERVVIGIFYTGVKLSRGSAGICFTPIKAIPESVCCPSSARAMPRAGRLKGMHVADTFEYLEVNRPQSNGRLQLPP